MTSSDLRTLLADVLDADAEESGTDLTVRSFEDACLMTRDEGLVVTLADGSEFQVTVVQSRFA